MVRFYNEDLKKNLVECIKYIINTPRKNLLHIYSENLELNNYALEEDLKYFESLKCIGEEYSDDEINNFGWEIEDEKEIIINNDFEIEIYFYDDDCPMELTVESLIDCIDKSKSSLFDDSGVCFSDKKVIFRVIPQDIYYDNTCFFPDFCKSLKYNDKNLEIEVSTENIFYALMLYFKGDFDEYNPIILSDDLFIEISSDEKLELEKESIYEIYNAYIFEIFASYNIKLNLNPRNIVDYDNIGLEDKFKDELKLRPLLFGKGLKDVIELFNDAESYGIDDRAIAEYIKVIEYVSQTVIRMEITEDARKKLNSEEALNPNANYIQELENIFLEYNNKYNTDRNAIKSTILKCCDIKQLAKYSPKFLKKLRELEKNLKNTKSNKAELLKNAFDELCDGISDTRNEISHAKANYSPKGHECPNNEKEDFVVLLRHICVQVIRWFSNVSEINRIINEEK